MPTRVNGCGTWYIGKNEISTERGVCQACHEVVDLQTYQTRLWVTAVLIPIIPLGKKQILEHCPSCSRHHAMPLEEYEAGRDKALREAMSKAEGDPDDERAALEMLGTLSAFHRNDEASRYAEIVATRFSDNAAVQFQLGAWYESVNQAAKGDACFHRAFELDPETPHHRRAMALGLLQQGKLEEARPLLAYLDAPDAEPDPPLHAVLAATYREQGDLEGAMTHYERLLEQAPGVAADKDLRKLIRQTEEALGRQDSILPERPSMLKRVLVATGVVVLVLAGLLGWNHYAKTHRDVHVVNGLDTPVTLTIDGDHRVTVLPGTREVVQMAEGSHQGVATSSVDGAAGEEVDRFGWTVQGGVGERFFGSSTTHVLNPAGAATLIEEWTTYGARANAPNAYGYRLHFADSSFVLKKIDYVFEAFPEEITVSDSETKKIVRKCRLSVMDKVEPVGIFHSFPENTPRAEQMRFAEHHLELCPDSLELVATYGGIAPQWEMQTRATEFLEKGLARRPVLIAWHRAHQDLAERVKDAEDPRKRYDQMLAQVKAEQGDKASDKDTSALLYLRGRVSATSSESIGFAERAIEVDPENAFAWMALAYHRFSRGEFELARQAGEKANQWSPEKQLGSDVVFLTRLVAEEYEPLRSELQAKVDANMHDVSSYLSLLNVLAAQGDLDAAKEAHERFSRQIAQHESPVLEAIISLAWAYLDDDMSAYRAAIDRLPTNNQQAERFVAALHDDDLTEAADALSLQFGMMNSLELHQKQLLLAMVLRRRGDLDEADRWFEQALEGLDSAGASEQRLAEALRNAESTTRDEMMDLPCDPRIKSLMLIAVAQRCEDHRNELLAEAERFLAAGGYFPTRLLRGIVKDFREAN